MSGPEGGERSRAEMPEVSKISPNILKEGYERSRGRSDRSSYGLAGLLMESAMTPEPGGNAYKALTLWLNGPNSPHNVPAVNDYGLTSLYESLNFRVEEDPFLRLSSFEVKRDLDDISLALTRDEEDSIDVAESKGFKGVLASAIAKRRLIDYRSDRDHRGNVIKEVVPEAAEMTMDEEVELLRFKKRLDVVLFNCSLCGEFGDSLSKLVLTRMEVLRDKALLDSGLLTDDDDVHSIEKELEERKKVEIRAAREMKAADYLLDESYRTGKNATEWLNLTKAVSGAVSILNGNAEQVKNAYDLDPIMRSWENMARMIAEMHPSNLIEALKQWPSFGEGFKGLLAIASGKYALGSNGEIYPTGAYGMGYIENGKIIDVDDAYVVDASGRRTGLKPGVTRLEEGQIWLDGRAVDVGTRENPDKKSRGKPFDGWNGTVEINGEPVKIFSKNVLYWDGINDENMGDFLNNIKKYVEGLEKAQGKVIWETSLSFGVALARNLFEMSLLSNWFGMPRDSKGRIYFGLYQLNPLLEGKAAPIREPRIMSDCLVISSNSESDEVRFGVPPIGWDEGTLFPAYINDWGKLLGTKVKQMSELTKGRKHGPYPILSYLPDSLTQPMFEIDKIRGMLEGTDPKYSLENIFKEMKSVGKLKTFWLGIAKGIGLYEFISSGFIGEKNPLEAKKDMLAFMMQPRNLEKLSKDIDLSLIYVDQMEAARLRVNIIITALASVATEFTNVEFTGAYPTGYSPGALDDWIRDVKDSDLSTTVNTKEIKLALRQLRASRFVGDTDDIIKIINRIKTASVDNDGSGSTELCFTPKQFEDTFGRGFLDRIWKARETRRVKVITGTKGHWKKGR